MLEAMRRRRCARARSGRSSRIPRSNHLSSPAPLVEPLESRVLLTTLYWDPQGAAGLGGAGTWDLTSANWSTSPTGSDKRQTWSPSATAVFGGTGGAVAVSRNFAPGAISITAGGYTFSGGHALTFRGKSSIAGDAAFQKVSLRVASGGALAWSGGNLTLADGSLFNAGTFAISGGGSAVLPANGFKNAGKVQWSYASQLAGDGVTDDAPAIRNLIALANTFGMKNITLPAGTFRLGSAINFYGSGITLAGQGDSTVLVVDHHYTGDPDNAGFGINAAPILDPAIHMVAAPVAGNTITLAGTDTSLQPGDRLLLDDGSGGVEQIDAAMGGAPQTLKELAPDETVTVKAVSIKNGQTIVKLTSAIVGTGDYQNISPTGEADIHYANVQKIITPADNLTVENMAMRFTDAAADASLYAHFTNNLTVKAFDTLDTPGVTPNGGSVWIVGSAHATVSGCTISGATISLNSTRDSKVTGNTMSSVELEEAACGDVISGNTINNANGCAVRVNDAACAGDQIIGNTMYEGSWDAGAIAISEATNITVQNNVIRQLTTGGSGDLIWLGNVNGGNVKNNTALFYVNYGTSAGAAVKAVTVNGNSWQ